MDKQISTEKIQIQGDLCHKLLGEKIKGKLRYNDGVNYPEWKNQIKDKLFELLGMEEIATNACELKLVVEEDKIVDDYRQIRFVFESEVGAFVPCYLLIPNTGKKKYPVAITLQGHASGFHNSIGVAKFPGDEGYITRGDFGRQATKHGYAALCIEQRAMGERVTTRHKFEPMMCTFPAMTALLVGRTILGERIWDVSRALDLIPQFDMLDTDKVLITGNSGGGTMSFYAACMDERIKISAPSCAFCSYQASLLEIFHCPCNFIPNAYKWFEMQDLACLIAPRNLIVIAGEYDSIFPIAGVKEGMKTVEAVFAKENVPDNCQLVVTPKAHWWCQDLVWPAINQVANKLGWFNE
ncbi:MAG: acetylxylan esterase [Clostridia bacterium]|nr:acetylxylan esterase [Clostridia bacterium]